VPSLQVWSSEVNINTTESKKFNIHIKKKLNDSELDENSNKGLNGMMIRMINKMKDDKYEYLNKTKEKTNS
jgi:hypothetical protein